jgi:thiol-disulfide isomerase/thioredoxin
MAPQILRSPASSLLTILIVGMILTAPTRALQDLPTPQHTPAPQTEKDIESRYKQDTESYEKAFDEFEKKAGLDQSFHYDLSFLAEYLKTQMYAGSTPAIRQLTAVYFSTLRDYDVPLTEEAFVEVTRLVPSESALWNKVPDSIRLTSEGLSPEAARKFLNDLVSQNPDRLIQARALVSLAKLASRQHESASHRKCYDQLASHYKDLRELHFDIALLNPDNKTAIGKKAAIFTLPSVENAKPFSNQSLIGSYYLLDFWATWCGPCMGERPVLRRAYERFKGKGFTIVSISLDEKPETVERFLKTRWDMPWANLILPGGQKSPTAVDYDVSWLGLPHLLLVGKDGTILAIRDQLGGEFLQKTLAEYLRP